MLRIRNQVTFRRKIYETIEQLQNDLDEWIDHYNNERTHQGKFCEGRTPMQTLEDGKRIWKEKFIDRTSPDRHRVKTGNCQIESELLQIKEWNDGSKNAARASKKA